MIHAAGVLEFEALASQPVEGLRAVMEAKVHGAWRLHEAIAATPLDLFVMCSSSSALLNSPLLGVYAGSNAVLDALAHHRRAMGLTALSVNWGTWGEVGMAVEAGRSASGDMLTGVGVLSNAAGLAALADLLRDGDVQAAVTPIDWPAFGRAYPAFAADPFLVEQIGEAASTEAAAPRQQAIVGRSPAGCCRPRRRARRLSARRSRPGARNRGRTARSHGIFGRVWLGFTYGGADQESD